MWHYFSPTHDPCFIGLDRYLAFASAWGCPIPWRDRNLVLPVENQIESVIPNCAIDRTSTGTTLHL